MGWFFEKRSNEKSAKPIVVIRFLLVVTIGILLIMGFLNHLDSFFFRLIFFVLGVGSVVDGVEHYLQGNSKKAYLLDGGLAILWLALGFGVFG